MKIKINFTESSLMGWAFFNPIDEWDRAEDFKPVRQIIHDWSVSWSIRIKSI